jgi:pheromone a factor receptor
MTIYTFYKRESQFNQYVSSSSYGPSRGRYFRLMALSGIEILGTIPIGTYLIVHAAKLGVRPYSWTDTHRHYSVVRQFAGFVWKNDPPLAVVVEMFRWLHVACAFIFFAFFGFADEARQHYRRAYTSLASRIGYSTFTLHGSSRGCVVHLLCQSVQTHWGSHFLFFVVLRRSLI